MSRACASSFRAPLVLHPGFSQQVGKKEDNFIDASVAWQKHTKRPYAPWPHSDALCVMLCDVWVCLTTPTTLRSYGALTLCAEVLKCLEFQMEGQGLVELFGLKAQLLLMVALTTG